MWHLQRSTLVCILVGLLALLTHNPAEAGMFGWFKRIDVQVSPEIKGAMTLHGKPQADMVIKRGTFFEDSWSWDSTRTDADGHFYFAEKTVKARQVLHERQVAVQLLAQDYPESGNEDLFFRIGESHDLRSPTRDLLTDGMHCELSADYTMSYLKFIENPSGVWRGFQSKCRFLHADKVIVSQAELDAVELERRWSSLYQTLAAVERSAKVLYTDQYARDDMLTYIEGSFEVIRTIPELETDPDKLNKLPELKQQFQNYLDLLNKDDKK